MLNVFRPFLKVISDLEGVLSDAVSFCISLVRSRTALAAENLFLRKQLGLFQEREKKASPTTLADRFMLSRLARFFPWRSALILASQPHSSAGIELVSATSGAGSRDRPGGHQCQSRLDSHPANGR